MATVRNFGFGVKIIDYPRSVSGGLNLTFKSFVLIGCIVSEILLLIYCGFFWIEFANARQRMSNIKVISTSGPTTNHIFGFRVVDFLFNIQLPKL